MDRNNNGVIEIDLLQVLEAFLKKAWLIVLCMLVFGAGAFAYTFYTVAPTYQSSVLFYVNNSNITNIDATKINISDQDITAAKSLVDTYIVILKTRNTLDEVIEKSGVDLDYVTLNGKISAAAVNETEVFRVTVTDTDPLRAEQIANTIAIVFPTKISEIVEGSSARVVDYAVIPTRKSGPNLTNQTTKGILVGAVIACIIILVMFFMDYQIHNEDFLIDNYEDIPLLGVIPDFDVKRIYGSYRYGKRYEKSSYGYYYEVPNEKEDKKKKLMSGKNDNASA